MIEILMVLFALSVSVEGVPIASCRDMSFISCFNPARFLEDFGMFNRGFVPAYTVGTTAIASQNPGITTVTTSGTGTRAGGGYSSGGSSADASSIASASTSADAGSYVTGPNSSTKAKGTSQSNSYQLKDFASTAASSSSAYAFGQNNNGERQYAGALTEAGAANALGDKGVALAQ